MWPRSSPDAGAAVAVRRRPPRHRVAWVLLVLLAANILFDVLRRRRFGRAWRAFPA